MPPKNIPQRRSREETLQEDLVQLVLEESMNDEEVLPILKNALSEGVDVNLVVGDRSLICYFAQWGMLNCFEECFLRGADPTIVTSEDSPDALVSAIAGIASPETSLRMVMFLLNHEKVNDLHHQQTLIFACIRGQFEVVRHYLRRDESYVEKVLLSGVCRGSIRLVEIALEFHASDVDQRLPDGRCLIHMAAELQDSSILQKLLEAGADIEARNGSIESPFQVAVRCNSVSCVKFLIGRKCDFLSSGALFLAVRCRSYDVLEELLKSEKLCAVKGPFLPLVLAIASSNNVEAFRIVYPHARFSLPIISQLVRFQRYEMLSAALFEFEHPGLSVHHLTQFITEAPNDDFKTLLEKKIDAMNGVDLVAKVKKEAEEEGGEAAEDFQSTSETTKNKKK